MKNLAGIEVEANIKMKGASRSDANSSAVMNHRNESATKANHLHEGHPSLRRSLSSETGNESEAHPDTRQLVKRQEGDINIILQTLETLQKETKSFQKEMKSLKAAVNDVRSRQNEQQTPEMSEDIDLLTETVANISGKVGEIDALKLESKMMQSRVKRLEDEKRGLQAGMEPPPTPRSASNSARPTQSFHSPRPGALPPGANPTSSRERASSVQVNHTPRTHARNHMPPPETPRSVITRALARPSSLRSTSESDHRPNGRSNLHQAVSGSGDGANELPRAVQAEEKGDEEYHEEESSPDPEDQTYHPRRRSLPTRIPSSEMVFESHNDPKSNKRRRTTSHALNRDNNTPPSPHPDDPDYRSIWAAPIADSERGTPAPVQRNEHGFIIKQNGQIDKRSLRFLGKVKNTRRNMIKVAPRDPEGYLLDEDGTRNPRSVRIIDGMRKTKSGEPGESVES